MEFFRLTLKKILENWYQRNIDEDALIYSIKQFILLVTSHCLKEGGHFFHWNYLETKKKMAGNFFLYEKSLALFLTCNKFLTIFVK